MAKKSKIAKNEQRRVLVERYAARRAELRDVLKSASASPEEKEAARITFARDMGWRWPLAMLEHYSLPQRKDAEIAASSSWLRDRHDRLNDLRKGLGNIISIKPESITKSERDLSRLVRHRVAIAA